MTFSSLFEALFWFWSLGFFFAVGWWYAAKAFFAPVGLLSMWSGPRD